MSIASICGNKKVLKEVLSILETKNLTTTELYRDLKPHLQLEEYRADNYVMATQNITGEQLEELKKNGMYSDSFAESLYKEDVKQKKTTDFTVPQNDKSQKYVNEDNAKTNNIRTALSILPDNKKVPLQEIGGDTCFVEKNGNGYILSLNGDRKECSSREGVENTLDAYGLFHRLGLKSVIPHMDMFLATIKENNPICPKFDVEKRFSPKKQLFLSGVANTIFDLSMEKTIA